MEKKNLDIKISGKHGVGKSGIGIAMYVWLAKMGFEVNFREELDDEMPISIEDNQKRVEDLKDVVIIDIEVKYKKFGEKREPLNSKIKYSAINGKL